MEQLNEGAKALAAKETAGGYVVELKDSLEAGKSVRVSLSIPLAY